MGDVLTLIEQAEQHFDAQQAEEAAAKIGSGELTLEDFLEQMLMIRKMGPIGNLLGMLPGAGQMKDALAAVDDTPARPRAGHHPRHDPRRARRPEDHQRLPPAAHRQRLRRDGLGGQPARRPLLRGPQDDVADGRADGHAVRPQGFDAQGGQGQEKQAGKKKGSRAPTPPKVAQPVRDPRRTARRVPRPVEHAEGSRRAAAGAGQHRPVQAEVPRPEVSLCALAPARHVGLLPDGEPVEWWVVDGRAQRRTGRRRRHRRSTAAGSSPGLVDAHCHVGLGPGGADRLDEAVAQAETERDVGRAAVARRRLADRHPQLRRPRRPAAHHPRGPAPRPAQAIHPAACRSTSRTSRSCPPRSPSRRAGATAGSSWSATGSTGASATSRRCGPTTCSSRRIAAAHADGARVTAHVFGEDALPGLINAGIDCIEHGTGLTDDTIALMVDARHRAGPDADQHRELPRHRRRGRQVPDLRQAHARPLRVVHAAGRRRARGRACPIYAGTDAGGMIAHGRIADEVDALQAHRDEPDRRARRGVLGCAGVAGQARARARRLGRSASATPRIPASPGAGPPRPGHPARQRLRLVHVRAGSGGS